MNRSPFEGSRSSAQLPERIAPGIPFSLEITATNHDETSSLLQSRLFVAIPPGLRFLNTLTIDGKRRVLAGTAEEVKMLLAPFEPGESRTISLDLVLEDTAGGISGGPDLSVPVELITPPDVRFTLSTTALIDVRPEFTLGHTLVSVAGPSEASIGDERDVTIVLVNDGTSEATEIALDLGSHDVDILGVEDAPGTLTPGAISILRARLRVSGQQPKLSPTLSYAGGKCELLPVSLDVVPPKAKTARELIALADVLCDPNGTVTLGAQHLGAFVLHKFLLEESAIAGETCRARLELLNTTNETIDELSMRLISSPGVDYAQRISINGRDLTLPDPIIRLKHVAPRAHICLVVDFNPQVATIANERAAIGAELSWQTDVRMVAVLGPFDVAPATSFAAEDDALPFTIDAPVADELPAVEAAGESAYIKEEPHHGEPLVSGTESNIRSYLGPIVKPYEPNVGTFADALDGFLSLEGRPTLFAIVATLEALTPVAIEEEEGAPITAEHYSALRSSFAALVKRTMMLPKPIDSKVPRLQHVESFVAENTDFCRSLSDAQDGRVSFAACLLVWSTLCGRQFPDHSDVRRSSGVFSDELAAFLKENDFGLELRLGEPAPISLVIAARDAVTALGAIQQEAVA